MERRRIRIPLRLLFTINIYDNKEATDRYGNLKLYGDYDPDNRNRYNDALGERPYCVPLWLEREMRLHGIQFDRFFWLLEITRGLEWRIINMFSHDEYTVRRRNHELEIYRKRQGRFRVLALDAGGVAGLFNARLLQKIQTGLDAVKSHYETEIREYNRATIRRNAEEVRRREQPTNQYTPHTPFSPPPLATVQPSPPPLATVQPSPPAIFEGSGRDFLQDVDHIMGTSAGAVNAIILAQHDNPTDAVEQCAKLWRDPELLGNTPLGYLQALCGVGAFISSAKYRQTLSQYIPPKLKLKKLKKDVLITTFSLDPADASRRWGPKIFNSADPTDGEELALDVAIRASAAPVLQGVPQGYIDGGLFNPSPATQVIPLFHDMIDENRDDKAKIREQYVNGLLYLRQEVREYLLMHFWHYPEIPEELRRLWWEAGGDTSRISDDAYERWAKDFVDYHLSASSSTLALLSIGTGAQDNRMILSARGIYNWGYLHWLIPSPLNNFCNMGTLMFSANVDRATEEMQELSLAAENMSFYRCNPGALTFDQFTASGLAIVPFLRETMSAVLEKDLNKLEVSESVASTVDWIMDFWWNRRKIQPLMQDMRRRPAGR